MLNYLDIPPRLSRKINIFQFFFQGPNWQWHFFQCFLDETISDCVPQIGILISWTCKKVQLMLLIFRFSNWLISKAMGFDSFVKISIEMFLVKFGLCAKNDLFVRPIFYSPHWRKISQCDSACLICALSPLLWCSIWSLLPPVPLRSFAEFWKNSIFSNAARISLFSTRSRHGVLKSV